MNNTYPIEKKREEMLAKGKSQKEVDEWEKLVREITQVIASKQLVPTCRTQCMRTAFQIPFDATVRVSLDTNLCMISEVSPREAQGTSSLLLSLLTHSHLLISNSAAMTCKT